MDNSTLLKDQKLSVQRMQIGILMAIFLIKVNVWKVKNIYSLNIIREITFYI